MINVALASKIYLPKLSIINFNALPLVYRPKNLSFVKIIVEVALVAGIGGVILLAWVYMNAGSSLLNLRSQLDITQSSIASQQTQIASLKAAATEAQAVVAQVELKADALAAQQKAMAAVRTEISEDVITIRKLLPPAAQLNSVSLSGGHITLSGTANTTNDVYNYARKLRESGRFSTTLLNSITRADTGNNTAEYSFNIELD